MALTKEQINSIVNDLMPMNRDSAMIRIGEMQISTIEKECIKRRYIEKASVLHTSFDYDSVTGNVPIPVRLSATWWRYLVGVVVSVAIYLFLPALIALIISFLGYFWSDFDADVTMLFAPAVSCTISIIFLAFILPKKSKNWMICMIIIFTMLGIVSALNNFMYFNNVFNGIGYLIATAAAIIVGLIQLKQDFSDSKLKTPDIIGITLTSVFCAIYICIIIFSNILVLSGAFIY